MIISKLEATGTTKEPDNLIGPVFDLVSELIVEDLKALQRRQSDVPPRRGRD